MSKTHSRYALGRQISAFPPAHEDDIGRLYLMVYECLQLLPKTLTQSPRWDQPPTSEMLTQESEDEREAQKAARKLEGIAMDIFEALTGQKITESIQFLPVNASHTT